MRLSQCHPDRPHYAKGMCRNCYSAARRRSETPTQKLKKQAYMKTYHTKRVEGLTAAARRDMTLQARYGITSADFNRMVKDQGGLCILCDRAAKVVDHCHESGRLRGILCYGCNTALNRVEVPGWTEAAHKYIKG